jgi:hypothetical protein
MGVIVLFVLVLVAFMRRVHLGMQLGGFAGVLRGVQMVAMGGMRVMRRGLMVAIHVFDGGFAMMFRRHFVMRGSLVVMLGKLLGVRHVVSPGKCEPCVRRP